MRSEFSLMNPSINDDKPVEEPGLRNARIIWGAVIAILLCVIGLSWYGYSYITGTSASLEQIPGLQEMANKGDIVLDFKELPIKAADPEARASMEGKTGVLTGMYSKIGNDKEFSLYRLKMTCCAADTIPLEARMVCQENLIGYSARDWVEVKGQIQFHKVKDRDKYIPVMLIKSADDVKKVPPQPEVTTSRRERFRRGRHQLGRSPDMCSRRMRRRRRRRSTRLQRGMP